MAESNLEGTPVWGQGQFQGTGGGSEAQQYYAWKKFSQLFGRNPTQSELDQLAGAYSSGDKNVANVSGGNSVVAQYYQNKTNTPEKQFADQQSKYKEDAPKFYDQINSQFQSTIGRDATQEEKDHFGSLLASGQVDPYTVGQFLTQLPEAVSKQDEQFRTNLRGSLKTEDSRYFSEQVLPGIQQNFAKSGRDFNSSGFANAAAQAAQQQNTAREGFLSNLTASQYTGNKTNAYNDYLNSVSRYQGNQDYSRARTDQLSDATSGRINDIQNFAMQKQAYDQYLNRYGKRSSGAGIGSVIGTGVGALGFFGGPEAGMMGMSAGSSFGGGVGGLFGR